MPGRHKPGRVLVDTAIGAALPLLAVSLLLAALLVPYALVGVQMYGKLGILHSGFRRASGANDR